MASSGQDPHYIVLIGDVGSGKSTLVGKVSGISGMSSQSSTSATRQSGLYYSTDQQILICDTPGSNPLTEKFESNAWIATAINYRPISRLVIVVKADVRIDNVIDTIRKYVENFLDLTVMEEIVGICVTHMDMVAWTPEEFWPLLENELGLDSVTFCGVDTTGTHSNPDFGHSLLIIYHFVGEDITNNLVQLCKARHEIEINSENFLKIFKISNNNVRVLRGIKQEVNFFTDVHHCFKEELNSYSGQDKTDLLFEYQAWMEENIIDAQRRVSEDNGFTFFGDNMMNEAGHIANMTNQLRAILFEVRTEILGYQRNHGISDLRRCPHCGLVWAKIEGCDGETTCGNRMRKFDGPTNGFLGTFSFQWSRVTKRLKISKKERRQLRNYTQENGGIGCGARISWKHMAPVEVPAEFNSGPPVTVDDIKLVPQTNYQYVIDSISEFLGNLKLRGTFSMPPIGAKLH